MLCRYERTIFKSDKGFCIFAYSTSDESVPKEARNRSYYHDDKIHFTAIGYHLIATDAVEVELDGTWENSKHGLQLSVSMCKEVVPRDQAGILAYLSSGIIKGIGPETAKAIVARFGDKTMEVLEKEPDKLLSVKGIAQKKLKAIIKSYGETKALSDLMIYLAPFGVSMKKVAMIREEFGDSSLRIVKTDPFQLCKIKGFGFMTVDSIARKTKVSLKHPLRYSGAINYFQHVQMQTGGYGVAWDVNMTVSDAMLYRIGKSVPLTIEDFRNFATHRVINAAEAAEILGCSRQNIIDLTKRGKLHPIKTSEKSTLYLKSEVLKRNWQ